MTNEQKILLEEEFKNMMITYHEDYTNEHKEVFQNDLLNTSLETLACVFNEFYIEYDYSYRFEDVLKRN